MISHDAKLFGSAANNGQMIAEIERRGKTAETFGESGEPHRRSRRDRRQKRGLFDPLLSKLAEESLRLGARVAKSG